MTGFLTGLGLSIKPEALRLRPSPAAVLTTGLSDLAVRLDELAKLDLAVSRALVIENEITFLSVPVAEVAYWGDLDTHGFAILNQLRAWPAADPFGPDGPRNAAGPPRPVGHRALPDRCSPRPADRRRAGLYQDLVTDRLGERVRLEQERIAWDWVAERLPC